MKRSLAVALLISLSGFARPARALEYYTFDRKSPGLEKVEQARVVLVGDLHRSGRNDERDQAILNLQKKFEAARLSDLAEIHRTGGFKSAVVLLEGVTSHRELIGGDEAQFIQDIEQKLLTSPDFKIKSVQGWDNVVEVKLRENFTELTAKLNPETRRHYNFHIQPMFTISLRNYLMAKRIEEVAREYPDAQIFVFMGLYHIHDNFLIELLNESKLSYASYGGLLGDAYQESTRAGLLKELEEIKAWESVAAANRRKVYAQLVQPMLNFIAKGGELAEHPAGKFFQTHVPEWEKRVSKSGFLAAPPAKVETKN